VRGGALLSPPELMLPLEAAASIDGSVPVFSTSPMHELATECYPDAAILASRATIPGPAEPIYLKPPHITTPKK